MTAFSFNRIDLLSSVIYFSMISTTQFMYANMILQLQVQWHISILQIVFLPPLNEKTWLNVWRSLMSSLHEESQVFTKDRAKAWSLLLLPLILHAFIGGDYDKNRFPQYCYCLLNHQLLSPRPPAPPSLPNRGQPWQMISWDNLKLQAIHATTATQMIMGSYRVMAIGFPEYNHYPTIITKVIGWAISEVNGNLTDWPFHVLHPIC